MNSHHYLHTGQRTCHADDGREIPYIGSGQDASFVVGVSWLEPRFDLRNDEVVDRLTGLIWCRSANPAEFPLYGKIAKLFGVLFEGCVRGNTESYAQ